MASAAIFTGLSDDSATVLVAIHSESREFRVIAVRMPAHCRATSAGLDEFGLLFAELGNAVG
jgi:hypothetical protein